MSGLLRRLRYWRENERRGAELREEMELHVAERAAELEEDGMTAEEARAEARRRFGNAGLKQEEAREVWMTRFWTELGQDVRYGLRTMGKNKTFSALAVLSLALGIGANTTVYSFLESILLRPLPVAEAERLVVLNWQSRPPQEANREWVHVVHGLQGMAWPAERGTMMAGIFPYGAYELMRGERRVFSTVFGYCNGLNHSLAVRGQAATAATEFVTGEYFGGLGVRAAAGRLIEAADDRAGAAPVAVVSYAVSQRRFGGPAGAIGQEVLVDRTPFTVIGVTPPEFAGVDPAAPPELYLPLHTNLLVDGERARPMYASDNFYWIEMMGRLRPGVSLEQAQAELAPRFRQWVAGTAATEGERAKLPALRLGEGGAGLGGLRRQYTKPLAVLLAMVGLILALACANLANLLLARAAARRREMALRLSLGAGRWRVVRQLLTESVLLAGLGGALGVVLAGWGVKALTVLLARGRENFTLHAELNWHVLGVTAALSVACGLLFGLAPALAATRPDVLPALKDGRGGGPRRRGQAGLVVAQMAMSFLIVVAAGLFARTLDQLRSIELGYARENILLFTLNAHQAGHREPERARFYESLRQRFEAMPGVSAATLAQAPLISAGFAGPAVRGPMKIGAATVENARVLAAGPRFLTTLQIPILAGREIGADDVAGGKGVAVISERLARTYFGGENPVGRRIALPEERRELEIVGVSANVRYGGLKNEGSPMAVFVAASQAAPERVTYALRTAGDPLGFAQSVREAVRAADASIPVTNVVTQAAEIDRTISREIAFAKLCTGFAILALLTACVGLYGTMSYGVTRQFGEIGIRMALGARRGTVVWMVLRRVLVLAGAGLAVSVPVAVGGARLVQSLLYGVRANDPGTLGAAAAVLVGAAVAAGAGPAWRAARIDPVAALRHE